MKNNVKKSNKKAKENKTLSDKKCYNQILKKYPFNFVNPSLIKKLKYPIIEKFFFTFLNNGDNNIEHNKDNFPLPDMERLYKKDSKFILLKLYYENKDHKYAKEFLKDNRDNNFPSNNELTNLFSDYYGFINEKDNQLLVSGRLILDWRIFFSNLRLNCFKEYRLSSIDLEVYSIFEVPITKLIKIHESITNIINSNNFTSQSHNDKNNDTDISTNFEDDVLNDMYKHGCVIKKMTKYLKKLKNGEVEEE